MYGNWYLNKKNALLDLLSGNQLVSPARYFLWKLVTVVLIQTAWQDSFTWPLLAFLLSCCIYPLASSCAHTFSSMSVRARHICFFFDYGALSFYSLGTFMRFSVSWLSRTQTVMSTKLFFDMHWALHVHNVVVLFASFKHIVLATFGVKNLQMVGCGTDILTSSYDDLHDFLVLFGGQSLNADMMLCSRVSSQLFSLCFPWQVGEQFLPPLLPPYRCRQHSHLHQHSLLLQVWWES